MTAPEPPVAAYPWSWAEFISMAVCSTAIPPTKTPVRVPRSRPGSMRARSIASHETSIRSRCCGSMTAASRGLIPKNPASKSPAPARKAPSRVVAVPGWSGSG
jgi:hypothetical protein